MANVASTIAVLCLAVLGAISGIEWIRNRLLWRRSRRHGLAYLGIRSGSVVAFPAMSSSDPGAGTSEPDVFRSKARIGELEGLMAASAYFAKYLPTRQFKLATNEPDLSTVDNLVLLGGPTNNTVTRRLLEQFENIYLTENPFTVSIAKSIQRVDVEVLSGGHVIRDIGIVLVAPNRFAESRFVLVCGFTSLGTGAVARYLFDDFLRRNHPVPDPDLDGAWGFIINVDVPINGVGRAFAVPHTRSDFNIRSLGRSFEVMRMTVDDHAVDYSAPVSMKKGSLAKIAVTLRNTGEKTWRKGPIYPVRLATTRPRDRPSDFASNTWALANRPAGLEEESVDPGDAGTFIFTVAAPQKGGRYRESFNLVEDGVAWFDEGSLTLNFEVVE